MAKESDPQLSDGSKVVLGVIAGGLLPLAACDAVGAESNLLVNVGLGIAGGAAVYLLERRRSRQTSPPLDPE